MKRGFSLVELSIVLIILGLIVGGVLAGQSLIRAAELRSVLTDYERITSAVKNFREKYQSLPGDMSDATSIWGAQHADPATCRTTASTGVLTCNGNDDGIVIDNTVSNESYRFWQHLANAGLMEGSFNGITQGTTNFSSTATNSPQGKLANSLWFAWYWGTVASWGGIFDGVYNNFITLGGQTANTFPLASIFRPDDVWSIDTKIDDGKPGQGKMVIRANAGLNTCTTTATSSATSADYLVSNSNLACTIIFRDVF